MISEEEEEEEGRHVTSSQVARSTVSDPEIEGAGRHRHTTYLVNTTIFPGGVQTTSLVRRRHSDFCVLEQQLILERPGAIVPKVIPDKPAHTEKFTDEFMATRCQQLDRFLKRVVNHPELFDAPFLKAFLTTKSGEDWEAAVKQAGSMVTSTHGSDCGTSSASQQSGNTDTFVIEAEEEETEKPKGRFRTWISNTRTKMALRKPNLQLEEHPEQARKFRDMEEYWTQLDACMKLLAEEAKTLLEAHQKQYSSTEGIGAVFTQLWEIGEQGQDETPWEKRFPSKHHHHDHQHDAIMRMYLATGKNWGETAKRLQDQHAVLELHLLPDNGTLLHELVLDVAAFKVALDKRKEAVYKYTQVFSASKAKQAQIDKYKSSNSLDDERYFTMEKEAKGLDAECQRRTRDVELISQRLDRDIQRFRSEFHEKIRSVLEMVHKGQADFSQLHAMGWREVMPHLEKLAVSEASGEAGHATAVRNEPALQLKLTTTTTGIKAEFEGGGGPAVDVDHDDGELVDLESSPSGERGPPKRTFSGEPSGPPPALPPPPVPVEDEGEGEGEGDGDGEEELMGGGA